MLAAIGRVAAESARVEDRLRELFTYLIESPYGRIITAGEDLSNLATMCLRVTRYNEHLTDEHVERLVNITKAVDQMRPFRNFLIHARWEKLNTPGEHYGIRSSRVSPSMRLGAQDTAEGKIWDPDLANLCADNFRAIADAIDRFIEDAFDYPAPPHLWGRAVNAKFREMFEPMLDTMKNSTARVADDAPPPETMPEL
jgi:hypothetical protein